MRLDFPRRRRQFVIRPGVFLRLAFRRVIHQPYVRIRNGRLFEPLIDRRASFLIFSFDLQRDLCPLRLLPLDLLVFMHQWFVFLRIDLHFEKMCGGSRARPGNNLDRFAGRELAIHARRGDPDPLLTAAHPHPMEL